MSVFNQKENINIKNITQKIIDNNFGVFDELFFEFIEELLQNIYKNIMLKKDVFNLDVDIEGVLLSIGTSFKIDLFNLCKRVLISELHISKKNLIGETSEDRYNYFLQNCIKNRSSEIYNESSMINYLVKMNMKNREKIISNFFDRLINDKEVIENTFNEEIILLNNINTGSGDTHNGGESVFIITFNNDKKLVYKPHPLDNDIVFNNLLSFINNQNNEGLKLASIKTINCGKYGWQEYIISKECSSEDEVKNYMYRFGQLICIAYLLGTTDLHFENIIAHGEFPVIVDVETLMYNNSYFRGEKIETLDGFAKLIADSVYSSMLLLQNYEFNNMKIEMSGIAGGYGVNDEYIINTVINHGSDEIQFEQLKVNITKTQNLLNVVKVNGENIRIIKYYNIILEGFSNIYNLILNKKQKFIEYINRPNILDGHYRQVLRSTATYAKYLEASYHPNYLINHESRIKVFNCLNVNSGQSDKLDALVNEEIKQLLEDDIPYFYTKFNSKDLFTGKDEIVQGFYKLSLYDILIKKLDKLSLTDLQRQKFLIKSSLSGTVKSDEFEVENNLREKFIISNEVIKDIIDKAKFYSKYIGDYINEYYSIGENNKNFTWFYHLYESKDSYELGSVKPIIYDGAGIVLLYLYLYKEFKEEKYYNLIKKTLNTINAYDINTYEGKIGFFDGIMSLAYINYNAYKVLNDNEYYEKYKQILKYLIDIDMYQFTEYDVVSGLSGIIISALNIYNDEKNEDLIVLANKCGIILLEKIINNQVNFNTGFAHGFAGISAAFLMLSNFTQNMEFYNLGIKIIKRENEYFSSEYGNWLDTRNENDEPPIYWCYGAPGILVSRFYALKYVNDEDVEVINDDIKICKKLIINAGLNDKRYNNLCHGFAGNLDILLNFAREYNDRDLEKIVYLKTEELIDQLINDGFRCSNPVKAINIDFMQGISGIAYYLLRVVNKEIPSILYLE